ncbi:uncharacterized protein LOC129911430 [Episyrphus balteatus]|uniref:uncharacterized protein LOC129911430 n=1 Tax=Episyrphus balteatus TaxID=286459 RepID=UPI0024855BCD|nr:uncharacterized protein LOC129911430 [Episyrphus balteatus]
MLKKFVPLDSDVEPSRTPYNIKTFKGSDEIPRPINIDPCSYEAPPKRCIPGKTVTIAPKPITVEEAIFRWFEIPQYPKSQISCNKRCQQFESYTACVMNQRSPKTLKHHAVIREKYLKTQTDANEKVHDGQGEFSNGASLIQMESLMVDEGEGGLKPILASPACSVETYYVPSRRLLDLKRPRSGIFINETPHSHGSDIPYETYNPRKLQEKLENEERQKYRLLSDGDRYYFPWMKKHEVEMEDMNLNKRSGIHEELSFFKPVIFPIPSDLEKTFRAAVVFGNEAISSHEANIRTSRPVEIACLYVAYVGSFSKNPDYWSAQTIDSIIHSGIELFHKSIDRKYENLTSDFDIIPELTEKQATIDIKLHLTASLTEEPNILKALTLFFDRFHAGILWVENLYFLIWKRCMDTFYIFDPNGRDMDCKRNSIEGKASLMAIQTIEHIVHLILNYSEVESAADFNLYEINLKDFGKLSNPMNLQVLKLPKKLYAVVNRFYSIIPALSGLPILSGGKPTDDNPSLMTSYLALVYSQIDPPREWTVQVIDDLIKFGKKYHNDFICDNRLKKLNIADLPEVLLFGNYRVLVEKKAFVESGHVVDCRSYRASQLTLALKNFLLNYNFGLLEVDSSIFGLWKERNMFFVFDPFKRGPAGQAGNFSKSGTGCLQIHLNLNSLCRMMFINSISIKTDGNFFLHGIRVKAVGTFSINRAFKDSTGFGTLQIKYPFDCEAILEKKDENQNNEEKLPISSFNRSIVQCLSELSVNPCQRICSEQDFILEQKKMALRKKLVRKHSIESIPDQYRIPEFDDIDVIDSVVGELMDDLMDKIQQKTEKKTKAFLEASKILLQSDRKHLEDLKMRLKRGEDFDNICSEFQSKASAIPKMTAEEELAIESNFKPLPDGSWAIFGRETDLDLSKGSLKGILSTITAAALSSKYKISTWSSDVIDYAIESCDVLEKRFWSYNHTLDLIFRKQMPKIQLGSTTFQIKVITTKTVQSERLKIDVESGLSNVSRLFLICKGLSCLILKRYNLIYMFMGCSCDIFGFRSQSTGPMCLLRFLEINALVRRIEQACGICQKYVLVELEVKNVTDSVSRKFIQRTESQEELLYDREMAEKEGQKRRFKEKLKFIESEIRKESKRIKQFKDEKQSPRKKKGSKVSVKSPQQLSISDTSDFIETAEEGQLYDESDKSIEFKHKPREDSSVKLSQAQLHQKMLPLLGYQLKDSDCLFKIQGSTALENRLEDAPNKIKTCLFASAIAILYAILRPLNNWDASRIDKVINVANNIANTTSNMDSSTERTIKNIDVDEFEFEINVYHFIPQGAFGGNLEYIIKKAVQSQRYILLQISNSTFTIYHDKYFHLFDPYRSMEIGPDAEEGTSEQEETPRCPQDITKKPEQNNASWILFGDLTSMLDYINKRALNEDWKTDYKLHAVSIVSHKIAPKRKQLLNMLTDEFDICKTTFQSDNLCTHPEEIEWLDNYPNLVIWSRLNRSNAVKQIRGAPLTKDKNFDIEIPKKLFSLWGSIHPLSSVFGESRNKQHLAINVVACYVAILYRVNDWNTQIIDSIVINGNDYYNESVSSITRKDYEISLEHLNTVFQNGYINLNVHLESVVYGYLYAKGRNELNLAAALGYFFTYNQYGIVQCMKRSLAIGKIESGYFMFECQSHGHPLFPAGEGAAYVLRTTQLQVLLYCIVMTLNNSFYNSQFTIHKVEIISDKGEDQQENEGEEE